MKITICVGLQLPGIHNWSTCNIESVSFLKYPHTHTFYFRCYFHVFHDDRDKEFFDVKQRIVSYLREKYPAKGFNEHFLDFGSKSCEMLASELLEIFSCKKVEVFEDNLDGAIVEKD